MARFLAVLAWYTLSLDCWGQGIEIASIKVAVDFDHEFDAGSGIVLNKLSKIQIDNLATLGKVWGFLKYHHPAVTAGTRQWDFDLFRIMPAILAAPDRAAANQSLVNGSIGCEV